MAETDDDDPKREDYVSAASWAARRAALHDNPFGDTFRRQSESSAESYIGRLLLGTSAGAGADFASQIFERSAMAENEITDAKIAAAEARTDAKFSGLRGEINMFSKSIGDLTQAINDQRSEAKSNRTIIVTTMVGSVIAIAALMVGLLSYGAATFYNGTVLKDVAEKAILEIQSKQPSSAK